MKIKILTDSAPASEWVGKEFYVDKDVPLDGSVSAELYTGAGSGSTGFSIKAFSDAPLRDVTFTVLGNGDPNDPIVDAEVEVGRETRKTDAEGKCVFQLSDGDYVAYVYTQHKGYERIEGIEVSAESTSFVLDLKYLPLNSEYYFDVYQGNPMVHIGTTQAIVADTVRNKSAVVTHLYYPATPTPPLEQMKTYYIDKNVATDGSEAPDVYEDVEGRSSVGVCVEVYRKDAPPMRTVNITVTDGENPVGGATVKCGEQTVTTGNDGKCTLSLAENGGVPYNVKVSKTGYDVLDTQVFSLFDRLDYSFVLTPTEDYYYDRDSAIGFVDCYGSGILRKTGVVQGDYTQFTVISETLYWDDPSEEDKWTGKTLWADKDCLFDGESWGVVYNVPEPDQFTHYGICASPTPFVRTAPFLVRSNGASVEGVMVTIGDEIKFTDNSGKCTFNLLDGDYSVRLFHEEYGTSSQNLTINYGVIGHIHYYSDDIELELPHIPAGKYVLDVFSNQQGTTPVGTAIMNNLDYPDKEYTQLVLSDYYPYPPPSQLKLGTFYYINTNTKVDGSQIVDLYANAGSSTTGLYVNIYSEATPPKRQVHFTITDGNNPIQGAKVICDGETGTTGSAGGCTLSLKDGTPNIEVSKEGYISYIDRIWVQFDKVEMELHLRPE